MWNFLGALFTFVLPIGLMAYLLIGYFLAVGYLDRFEDRKGLKAGLKDVKASLKKVKKKNPLVAKWIDFGGGFYGLAGFYTYAVIEFGEVVGFIFKMMDPANWTFAITIDLIIGLIVNAVINLITAFLWFTYWPPSFDLWDLLTWIGFAYFAYVAGGHLARDHDRDGKGLAPWWREKLNKKDSGAADKADGASEAKPKKKTDEPARES